MQYNNCQQCCSQCNQPLIKSIEGIPIYYSFTNQSKIDIQPIQQPPTILVPSYLSSSIQSPKYKDMIIKKNIKYNESCVKCNLLIVALLLLMLIVFLIIYESRNN